MNIDLAVASAVGKSNWEQQMTEKANYHDGMPPDQRREELAAILGRGLQRLFSRCGFSSVDENRPRVRKALDVSPETDPVVSRLTTPRS